MQITSQRRASSAGRSTAALIVALVLAAFAGGKPASAQELGTIRFDNWLYFQENIDDSERWQYRPRFYIPFNLPRGWTFTQRIDLPVSTPTSIGPDNPTAGGRPASATGSSRRAFTSPEVSDEPEAVRRACVSCSRPAAGRRSARNQYQWAPAIGLVYAVPDHKIAISPLVRYFMSYHAVRSGGSQVRRLDLFPTVTFGLPDDWSLVFLSREPDRLQRRHQQVVRADRRDAHQAADEDRRVRLRRRPTAWSRTIPSTSTSSTVG